MTSPEEIPTLEPEKVRRIFVALAADYGNLGDLAITHAQVRYLKSRWPDAQVIELPISRTLPILKGLTRSISHQRTSSR